MEKKKLSLKEIGLPKLVMLMIIGIFLIISSLPGFFTKKKEEEIKLLIDNQIVEDVINQKEHLDSYVNEMENRLKNMLKKVSGIGDVEVMITLKSSKEKITLKDSPYTQESLNEVDGEGGSRTNKEISNNENTILVTNERGEMIPYIIQEIEPEIEGVLVIATGGDNAKIINDIVEASEVLFGIPVYKIKVMKMSDE
ncbi:MAG TPA: stage III sporulation protein AG [Clostridiales bacterium]|nr:stage III sporulation protein AG [Clostridiales bacterium]